MKKSFCVICIIAIGLFGCRDTEEPRGRYIGDLVTKALADGRNLELVEPYVYEDSNGLEWGVPKGHVVDGASIPAAFWSIIGGPLSGKYRNASVIHDFYCDTKHRPWEDVHWVFHEAMLTSGVNKSKARAMYYAVYRFGPKWEVRTYQPTCPPGVQCLLLPGVGIEIEEESLVYIEADAREFARFLKEESPSLEDIQAFSELQIERLGANPEKNTKLQDEFYPYFEGFPETFDEYLSEEELFYVREKRSEG